MTSTTITPMAIDALVRVDYIKVVGRHRHDLGDLTSLTASIEEIGLLHPITLTRDGRLIAGQRRLEACRRLGWVEVPVRFADNIDDATKLLHAERDENTCRKDMLPSEKVALAETLRGLLRQDAERRRREGNARGGRAEVEENFTSTSQPQVRDQLGALVGLSGPTYDRAREVVKATEHEDAEVRRVAEAAREEMDRTGKVTPAFDKVARVTGRKTAYDGKAKKRADQTSDPQPPSDGDDWIPAGNDKTREAAARRRELIREMAPGGYASDQIGELLGITTDTVRRLAKENDIVIAADAAMGRAHRRIDSNRIIRETVRGLANSYAALDLVKYDEVDTAEIKDWTTSLSKSIQVLNRLNKRLKEMIQ